MKITAPNNSPNTDGIDPSASSNITIRDSYISDGDDHIALKAGIGHVSNVTITQTSIRATASLLGVKPTPASTTYWFPTM